MWWRILNILFGWDFVCIIDCSDTHIRKVTRLPNGTLMGTIVTRKFFIEPNGKIRGGYYITDWEPLTWKNNEHS